MLKPTVDLMTQREHEERRATALFLGCTLVTAIVCGAIIVSGWFAGVIEDGFERVFWAGAILAGAMVAVLAGAAFPGGTDDGLAVRRMTILTRIGLILFIVSPSLCVGALVADFFL